MMNDEDVKDQIAASSTVILSGIHHSSFIIHHFR